MTKKHIFDGVCTALVTPFCDGEIDYSATATLIDRQIESGVDALLFCGTTGESSTLSHEERLEFLRFCHAYTNGRVPVIAGTGGNNTRYAIEMSKFAEEIGYDALLVVTPYYNKATGAGLICHYTAIAESVNTPIIIYNVPTRTCVDMSVETVIALSKIKNIVGIKEASPSLSKIQELIFTLPKDFAVYTGNDEHAFSTICCGGGGVISVVSNAVPRKFSNMCHLVMAKKYDEARRLFGELLPLMSAMFCEVSPVPVKYALSLLGLCSAEVRLPLIEIEKKNAERVGEALTKSEN